MIRIHDLTLLPGEDESRLRALAAKRLRIPEADVLRLELRKKSVDARKKNEIRVVYTVDAETRGDERKLLRRGDRKLGPAEDPVYRVPAAAARPDWRPVVVGFGPGGMRRSRSSSMRRSSCAVPSGCKAD